MYRKTPSFHMQTQPIHDRRAEHDCQQNKSFFYIFSSFITWHFVNMVKLDERQKAFMPRDGCAENILCLDTILRHHRKHSNLLFIASMDITKAFDSISHATIRDTLKILGIPESMTRYIMFVYKRSTSFLSCDIWKSDDITLTCGVNTLRTGDEISRL